jgi:hypothetical protein
VLEEVLGAPGTTAHLIDQQRLKSRVYRLRYETSSRLYSLVLKRLQPRLAQRNELVARRWLPALGLAGHGPVLLGVAAERSGRCVWHIYEDLGERALDASGVGRAQVEAAVTAITQLHARSAGHVLLPECRLYGGDLGIHYYTANVRDAICSLESLQRVPSAQLSAEHCALRDSLLARLHKLLDEQPYRAHLMAEVGGPEVLLHGDLWTSNLLACPEPDGLRVRLIDWDHVGVGPISYDLSAFLYRFPARDRGWILELYRDAMGRAGWHLPSGADLNVLFETAEWARLANRVIWPAMAVAEGHAAWGFEELARFAHWFETMTPVLPRTGDHRSISAPTLIQPVQPAPAGNAVLPRRVDQ